jgi:tRNA/tmRNA/rRNA uracil-C5-methylase (TrmA/RlmC/RlmD family)
VEPVEASAHFVPENLAEFAHTLHREPLEEFVAREAPAGERSVVIVDPPRTGLSAAVREWLRRGRPRQLFYVSCDPSTLARDLRELSSRYHILRVLPFDFFPQTSHIESLSILTPKGAAW